MNSVKSVNSDDVQKDSVEQGCFCVVLEGGMWGLRHSVGVSRSRFSCSLYRCKITALKKKTIKNEGTWIRAAVTK